MKKSMILCIMVLFMTSAVLTAQVPEWQWATRAGGASSDYGFNISVDAYGNSYVTGYFSGTVTFGDFTLTSSGSADFFAAKMDSDGNWLWAKRAGGSGNERGYGIIVDAYGNSYVTGFFFGTATFGDFTLTSSGLGDVFVAKMDSDGNWLWAKGGGGSSIDYSYGISIDSDGNSYVTGKFQGTATFGAYIIISKGSNDCFVIKLDTDGNWLWVTGGGGSAVDQGVDISVDADGNSYVTGIFQGTAFFGADSLTSSGAYDVFVAKLGTDGNWQWAEQAGGSENDWGRSIIIDSDGNSYVTGDFKGTAFFRADSLASNGNQDIFVAKIDADGNWLWADQAGGTSYDEGHAINVDADGNSYVTGYFGGTASFGANILTSKGNSDIFVAKLGTDGNWLFVTPAGGINAEHGDGISLDAYGNLYVTGYFGGTASFGFFTITSIGSNDIYVAKFGEAGLIGDFNSDGYVDAADLQLLGDHWHFIDTDPGWDALYDLVPDNIIDAADLQVFGDHWHEGTPPKSGEGSKDGKGPNADAGIVFDLDRTTYGNQNLTSIPSQPAGTYIPVDVYCTGVSNLDTYEFEVIYDATELTYISSSATNPINYEENILTTNGGTALGWMVDTSTPGVLSIAYTLAGNDPSQAPEGEGLIADIVFQALVNTYGTLSFGDVYYYDSYGVVDLITDTGTATLPVELSSFNAIYNTVSGFVSLFWATASETDVNGFNIYRNTEDSFGEADKINVDLIEGSGTTTETTEYSFTDETADPYYTTYYYWLQVINFGGTSDEFGPYNYIPIDVNQDGELGIVTSALSPCYPNPARIGNEIKFNFRVGGLEGTARNVELKVYNILGKLVAEVVNGERLVNDYTETWKPENLSNGVYFYQLKTDNYSEVKKMMIQ